MPSFVLEAMGWATAAAAEASAATMTTTDAIYSRGADGQSADEDANLGAKEEEKDGTAAAP